jgi:hypothetical protein
VGAFERQAAAGNCRSLFRGCGTAEFLPVECTIGSKMHPLMENNREAISALFSWNSTRPGRRVPGLLIAVRKALKDIPDTGT